MIKPAVIWLTGLSGAGKTTIATQLVAELRQNGLKAEHLDGDTLRRIFPQTGFSKKERNEHIQRVGYLAGLLEKNGIFVVASFISPYRSSRLFARQQCQNFIEVYLSTPLEVCEKRDPKGLYKKARRGEIHNFTGIDDPYEVPEDAEVSLDTNIVSADEAVHKIQKLVLKQNDGSHRISGDGINK